VQSQEQKHVQQVERHLMQTGFAFTKLADHLASVAALTDDDVELLCKMPCRVAHYASHEVILQKGDRPSCCCLLLQGYLCWRDAGNDERQITSIHVPGDVPDLQAVISPIVEESLCTTGPAIVAFVPHSFFREISLSPNLNHALSLLTINDAACSRNWIVNLGSRNSLARVAHLICEIAVRLLAVGHGRDYCFPSPFTQSDLAAACGITAVHVNRVVQELRRLGMLRWQSRTIAIENWRGLAKLARFTPDYLGLRNHESLLRDAPFPLAAGLENAEDNAGLKSEMAAASGVRPYP
jgi:CRP-like cAMP-binding protein